MQRGSCLELIYDALYRVSRRAKTSRRNRGRSSAVNLETLYLNKIILAAES